MKRGLIISCVLLKMSCLAIDNDENDFIELSEPQQVYTGMSILFGLGFDCTHNKYEQKQNVGYIDVGGGTTVEAPFCKPFSGKLNTTNGSFSIGLGWGELFKEKYFLGVDAEIFKKFMSRWKTQHTMVESTYPSLEGKSFAFDTSIRSKNAIGLTLKSRIGYILPKLNCLVYAILGCERFQHTISRKTSEGCSGDTYGSMYPVIGLGIEKSLRNNFKVRGEVTCAVGVWDTTDKYLKNTLSTKETTLRVPLNVKSRYKAKGNRVTFKLILSKKL